MVIGATRFWPGAMSGVKAEHGAPEPASPVLGTVLLLGGVALSYVAMSIFGAPKEKKDKPPRTPTTLHENLMVGAAFVGAALVLALCGRDLALKPEGSDAPGAIRLLQLFTYNYKRPWPDSLDFSAVLTAFSVLGVVLTLALVVRRFRGQATLALMALGLAWAFWGVDDYLMATSPHWGQHEVIQAYYANRGSDKEPLVAYQMNWKGENFYTGNKIPAFVSSGATFTNWLKKERENGVKVMYFITEHSRTGGLKSEVQPKNYREVTDRTLCNKFVLVRAEL
jgi:hypothetical protein